MARVLSLSSKYLNVTSNIGLTAYPIAFAGWYYLESPGNAFQPIFCLINPTTHDWASFTINYTGGENVPRIEINSGGNFVSLNQTTHVSSGAWHHIAFSWTGDTARSIWVNGTKATNSTSRAFTSFTNVWVGARQYINDFSMQYTNSTIGPFYVFKTAISDDEAAALTAGVQPWLVKPDIYDGWDLEENYEGKMGNTLSEVGGSLTTAINPAAIQQRSRIRVFYAPNNNYSKTVTDSLILTENKNIKVKFGIADSFSLQESLISPKVKLGISDNLGLQESLNPIRVKFGVSESLGIQENFPISAKVPVTDNLNFQDILSQLLAKLQISENLTIQDSNISIKSKLQIPEGLSLQDNTILINSKVTLQDTLNLGDTITAFVGQLVQILDTLFLADNPQIKVTVPVIDDLHLYTDLQIYSNVTLTEDLQFIEEFLLNILKQVSENLQFSEEIFIERTAEIIKVISERLNLEEGGPYISVEIVLRDTLNRIDTVLVTNLIKISETLQAQDFVIRSITEGFLVTLKLDVRNTTLILNELLSRKEP